MPDLFAIVRSQRSCRAFRPGPIEDAVIREERRRRAIGDLNRQVWENGARVCSGSRWPPARLADVSEGVEGGVRRELAEPLALPPHVRPMTVALGWPKRLGPPHRHPFETRTQRDSIGHPREARQ